MTATPGEFIAGRYLVEAVIGSGGIGTVYRAIQEPLHRPVALKVLHPALSGNPSVRARFVREARAVAALSHPNIAMVHDFGASDDDTLYMAMELVDGMPLDAALHAHAPSFAWLRDIFDQVLAGLAHAHARGVIHRDIKPANVIVTSSDDALSAKLVDFGIASVQGFDWSDDADNTGSGRVIGTPHFMAPEQARGERHVTTTLDIYTVGLMLFWAVTGRHAFDGETPMDIMMAQVSAPIPEIVPRPGIVPPDGLAQLIHDALQKSPRDRIPSASAFRARLRSVGGGTDSWTALPSRPAPRPRRTTRTEEIVRPAASPPTMLEPGPNTLLEPGIPTATSPAPAPTDAARSTATVRLGTPLVGRVDERHRLLDAAVEAASQHRGLLITVEGEAGMGKSTLARWLRGRLTEDEGFRAVFGGFHREGERGLRGVREAIGALFDVRGLDDARVAAAVAERMSAWGMTEPRDARRLVTFLRPAVRTDDDAGTADTTHALFELVLRVLERASADAPLFVLLDDLHWAGPETGAFLEYLATEFADRDCRLVVLATVQLGDVEHEALDETLRQLSHHQGTTVLRHALHSMTDDEARTLVATMLNASAALADALVRRAAGNPMHLVQLVRYLTEEALVEPGPDGWRARDGVDVAEVLPPSLADIVLLRIEQVEKQGETGERVRALLDRCAVLGRSCRFSVLEHMLRIEHRADLLEHIDADIDLLLDEELLRMTETRTDDVLSFPTSLIRDVILERLRNRRTTRRLHLYAAEAKLAVRADESDKLAPQLMEHFAAARQRRRELEYARIAAEVAARSHRPHDAVRYLERAIALIEELGDDDGTTVHELGLQVAAISTGFGSYDVAEAWYRRALEAADDRSVLRARALFGLADIAWITGHFDDAAHAFVEGTALARVIGDAGLLAAGLLGQARLSWHRGRPDEARDLADEALARAIEGGAAAAVPEAQWLRADLARARGDVDEAASLFQVAIEGYREQDRPLGLAKCYSKLAVLARMQDDLDRAVEQYRAALEIYQAHGGRRGVAHQLNGLGDVARYRGDLKLASEHYRRAVDIFQSLRLPYDAAIALSNLGLTARESGNLDEAVDALQRALRVSERVGYAYLTLGVKLNLAHVLALRGETEASERLLSDSLELADDIDIVDPDYASPLEQLGDLMHASGRRREAAALYARAADMWRELGRPDDFERVDNRLRTR